MDLNTTKIVVAILFGILRFFFGVLPIKLYKLIRHWEDQDDSRTFINEKRHAQVNCAVAMCQSFGGGVLFATCFLHMMVDAYFSMEQLKQMGHITTEYPLSQMIISCGFFFVYFLEETAHWFISEFPQNAVECRRIKRDNKPSGKLKRIAVTPTENKVSPTEMDVEQLPAYSIEEDLKKTENSDKQSLEKVAIDSATEKENQKNLDLDNLQNISPEPESEEMKNEEKSIQQVMRFVLVVLALALHAVFEGLAIGIQRSAANIWYLFVAVTVHSITILFCVGLELLLAKTSFRTIYIQMFALAMASPVGVILGLIITVTSDMNTAAKSTAAVVLEGFSAGNIVYITFFEILNREKQRRVYRIRRGICIIAGFSLMAVLEYIQTSH